MGGGASKSDSCAANVLACWFAAGSGLSYSQVLATNRRPPDARASREANFGTASQVLAASANSLSRATMAAMTRVAHHGGGGSALEDFPRREQILRRFPAVFAGGNVVALRRRKGLSQLFDTLGCRTNRCGILQ